MKRYKFTDAQIIEAIKHVEPWVVILVRMGRR